MKNRNDIANELQAGNKAIGGEWYFYDSIKNRWGGYSVGEWISLELATKLSDKKLDTRSIGKISFTGLGGNNETDYKTATDTANKIVEAVNNYQSLKESNAALMEASNTVLSVLEDWNGLGNYTNLIEHLKTAINNSKKHLTNNI